MDVLPTDWSPSKTILHLEFVSIKTEDLNHFFDSLAQAAKANIHITVLYGSNEHHKIEAVFKAFAKAVDVASQRDTRISGQLPSTKGTL